MHVGLCVCVSVRTIKPKRLKLQSPNFMIPGPGCAFNIRSKGQRSKSQGHKVQKHISVEGDRVAGVSLHSFCTLSSARPLVQNAHHTTTGRDSHLRAQPCLHGRKDNGEKTVGR